MSACVHVIGPPPSDPNVRTMPCRRCGVAIRLYQEVGTCAFCGGLAMFGMLCVTHDPRKSN